MHGVPARARLRALIDCKVVHILFMHVAVHTPLRSDSTLDSNESARAVLVGLGFLEKGLVSAPKTSIIWQA